MRGIRVNSLGEAYTTTNPAGTDVWVGGLRLSQLGQVVVGNGVPAARPYNYVGGFPFDKRDGSLIRQLDLTPAPSDPYVVGIRVGSLGGVYMSNNVVNALVVEPLVPSALRVAPSPSPPTKKSRKKPVLKRVYDWLRRLFGIGEVSYG